MSNLLYMHYPVLGALHEKLSIPKLCSKIFVTLIQCDLKIISNVADKQNHPDERKNCEIILKPVFMSCG